MRRHAASSVDRVPGRNGVKRRTLHDDLTRDAGEDEHGPPAGRQVGDDRRVGERGRRRARTRRHCGKRVEHRREIGTADTDARREGREAVQRGELRERSRVSAQRLDGIGPAVLYDFVLEVEKEHARGRAQSRGVDGRHDLIVFG
jgi:hypothetical protein